MFYLLIREIRVIRVKRDFIFEYIHKQAGQDIQRRISRIFVAVLPDKPEDMIGYYTLSSLSIGLEQLTQKMAGKLPKHLVPSALIGRLAVNHNSQGYGIAKMLLVDAIQRTLSVIDQIAIHAMVVDAINDNAKGFYEQFGFVRLSDNSPRLFLPLKSIEDKS